MKKDIYTGELAKPMAEFILPRSSDDAIEAITKDSEEEISKILLLLKHYNLDLADCRVWKKLSIALARKHVPGFRRVKKTGAKKKWNVVKRYELKEDIDNYIVEQNKSNKSGHQVSISQACRVFSKNKKWASYVAKTKSPDKALLRQYYNAEIDPEKISYARDELFWEKLMQMYNERNSEKIV